MESLIGAALSPHIGSLEIGSLAPLCHSRLITLAGNRVYIFKTSTIHNLNAKRYKVHHLNAKSIILNTKFIDFQIPSATPRSI